jgi:hypothetical protein
LKKPAVLLGIGFVVAVLAVLVYSSLGLKRYRVEVCMVYNGREACRTAAGATAENAQRTAISNACAQIASGMTDSMACTSQEPFRVVWVGEAPEE